MGSVSRRMAADRHSDSASESARPLIGRKTLMLILVAITDAQGGVGLNQSISKPPHCQRFGTTRMNRSTLRLKPIPIESLNTLRGMLTASCIRTGCRTTGLWPSALFVAHTCASNPSTCSAILMKKLFARTSGAKNPMPIDSASPDRRSRESDPSLKN
jgi:hypothetical protein